MDSDALVDFFEQALQFYGNVERLNEILQNKYHGCDLDTSKDELPSSKNAIFPLS